MLTQEEYEDYVRDVTGSGEIFFKHHLEALKKYVEKPPRKVQVGDVYKLKGINEFRIVQDVGLDTFITSHGTVYSFNGKSVDSISYTLDMSKAYKLVEVCDE